MFRQNLLTAGVLSRILLIFLSLFTAVIAQQNETDDDKLKISTDLYQTSVIVLDKNNQPVEGLKAEQFELRVDDKVRSIEFFDANNTKPINSAVSENQNTPENYDTKMILRERKIVFFIDDLHLSLDGLNRSRLAIKKFVDNNMLPLDQILLVTSSGRLGFLQQLTDNPAVILKALDLLTPYPDLVRDLDQPPMPEYVAIQIANGDKNTADFYVDKLIESMVVNKDTRIDRTAFLRTVVRRAENIVKSLSDVSRSTLDTMRYTINALSRTRGRKLVFFFSDGFFLPTSGSGFVDNTYLQRLASQASKENFTFYTIDTRGLFNNRSSADGSSPLDPSGRVDIGRLGEESASQEALFEIADGTGGSLLRNRNNFDQWIDRVLVENATYYTLAWSPSADELSRQKFKKIKVSVIGQPNLTVRFQNGFLTGKDKSENDKTAKNLKKQPENLVLQNTRSETDATNLLPTILSVNYLDVPGQGGVITSSIQIQTDQLDYGADNKQTAQIDLAGIILNERGKQVADFKTGLNFESEKDPEQNIIYNTRTPLTPGIYMVKVAVREVKTQRVGGAFKWIEIPDLSRRKLTLGSLLLGGRAVDGNTLQIQFSVNHHFPRPLKLNFLSFIYNSSKTGGGELKLTTQIEVFDSRGQKIINSPARLLETKGIEDSTRIPLKAIIKKDDLTAGIYTLRVTVNDLNSQETAVRQTVFTIE